MVAGRTAFSIANRGFYLNTESRSNHVAATTESISTLIGGTANLGRPTSEAAEPQPEPARDHFNRQKPQPPHTSRAGATLLAHPSPAQRHRHELVFWLVILVAARLACLIALNQFTGGLEPTDDVLHHYSMMRDPLQILLSTNSENAQFPPLLPFVEAAFALPFMSFFEPTIVARLAYITMETVAFAMVWLLLGAVWSVQVRRWLCAAWIIAPVTWMTSVVMAQEEMISAIAFSAICLLLLRRRLLAAILVCSLGVVTAKIFFLVPLLALVVGPGARSLRQFSVRAGIAALPLVVVYGITTYFRLINGDGLPLSGFSPPANLSVTFWSKVDGWQLMPIETIKYASMVLALAAGVVPLVLFKVRRVNSTPMGLIQLCTAMVVWVFSTFYIISPEYYMLVIPGLFLVLRPRASMLFTIGALTVAWMINFFHGVMYAVTRDITGGKAKFVDLYRAVMPVEPHVMHVAAIAVFAVCSIALAVWLTARSRPDAPDAGADAMT